MNQLSRYSNNISSRNKYCVIHGKNYNYDTIWIMNNVSCVHTKCKGHKYSTILNI